VIAVETLATLVPGPASEGVDCLPANNNLDLTWFGGRLWLAWRTAPNHFASARARLEVASAERWDGRWRREATVALGADVREPRWVADGDRLQLWFMRLGTDPKRFQPDGVQRIVRSPVAGAWSEPSPALPRDLVPWRVRRFGGRWALIGYRGGERMYGPRPVDPVVELRWSDDLERWGDPVDVHVGGCECELLQLPDGRWLGVTRNEGPTRRGSDVLVGPDLDHLSVTPIARKLDSPNLFLWAGEPFVFARRQVAHSGRYDHVPRWVPGAVAIRIDQAVWSLTRKRSTLYRVDVAAGSVDPVVDLPGRGDTAFTGVVPESPDDAGPAGPEGPLLVADYSSAPAVGDRMWLRGQLNPTEIALHRLTRG
jgi:hypothetical protein